MKARKPNLAIAFLRNIEDPTLSDMILEILAIPKYNLASVFDLRDAILSSYKKSFKISTIRGALHYLKCDGKVKNFRPKKNVSFWTLKENFNNIKSEDCHS